MADSSVLNFDLTEQVSLVKSGQISSLLLAKIQTNRIQKLNPSLNAFLEFELKQQVAQENNALAGLGVAIKDNIDALGFNTTAGVATRANHHSNTDAFVIALLRQAGARILGKLNMHEGALGATNNNEYFGKCHNPHQHGYTPGGSSGGAASAVASGMIAAALGTDTMGSIRIPASYCGVFGFKPSRGMVSNRGTVPCAHYMDNIGPIARSARDIQLMMSIMAKYDPLDPLSKEYSNTKITGNTILVPDSLDEFDIEESVLDDFIENVHIFTEMGFVVKSTSLKSYNFQAARRSSFFICEAETRTEFSEDWQTHKEMMSKDMQNMFTYVDNKSPIDLAIAHDVFNQALLFSRELFMQGDYLLLPSTPQRSFKFEQAVPVTQADLTSFANQAGLPSISIPMLSNNVLPSGMQLLGPQGSDTHIMAIARKWEIHTEFKYVIPRLNYRLGL